LPSIAVPAGTTRRSSEARVAPAVLPRIHPQPAFDADEGAQLLAFGPRLRFESLEACDLLDGKVRHHRVEHQAPDFAVHGKKVTAEVGKVHSWKVHLAEGKAGAWTKRRPAAGKLAASPRPTIIEITDIYFEAFEFGLASTDQVNNAARLTRTLLHELVHWVREQANALDDVDMGFKAPPMEAGQFFEQLAFGSAPLCDDANIQDAILSVRKP
jgi:hypothetical protein